MSTESTSTHRITVTPFLWFDSNAEDAIKRYLTVFDDAELVSEQRNPDGSLFIGEIRLQGQTLTLMNGGPSYQLTEAFSLSVSVDTQEEVDRFTAQLIEGGGRQQPCGWLVDAFGLAWQIVPKILVELMSDPDREKADRVTQAMLRMTKIDIQALKDAYDGVPASV
jgi:predicted 3-demethylubiquinone-9 3-methyltransferase (glyoxalase superfamily)